MYVPYAVSRPLRLALIRALAYVDCGKWPGSDHFFTVINATSAPQRSSTNSSSSIASGTLECFSNAFWSESSNLTEQTNRSREVLDRVRFMLLSQATAEALSALNQQIESPDAGGGDNRQTATSVRIVDSIFNSTRKLLEASAQNALQTLSALQSRGGDSEAGDGDDDDPDNLSADAKSPSLVLPIAVPDLKAMEALENLKLSLQKGLEIVFPSASDVVEKILNSSAVEWGSLQHHVQTLEDQKTALQSELYHVLNATWGQLNRSAVTTRAMLVLTELEVLAAVNDLNQQWNATVQKTLKANVRSWRAIEQRVRPFISEFAMHMTPFTTRSYYRELEIDEFPSDNAFAQRQYGLLQRQQDLQLGSDGGDDKSDSQQQNQEFGAEWAGVRVRALVSAGFDVWRFVRRLLLAADWSFACLKILEVVIELWTDSYSSMASVDIREVSSIQSMVRACGSPGSKLLGAES